MSRASARRDGFTLIELMIVIAIIAIIAAIAIPNLLASRKAANESATIGLLKAVHAAQTLFRDRDYDQNGTYDYSRESGRLKGLIGVAEFDDHRPVNGYLWGIVDDPSEPREYTYFVVALPASFGKSGDRLFSIDEAGVIRFSTVAADLAAGPETMYSQLRAWQAVR